MKNIILIIAICLITFCNAQVPVGAPIIPMSNNWNADDLSIVNNGSYFKDDANKMNPWVGTWKYTNGNTEFKIVITKETGFHMTPLITGSGLDYYTDLLNGGYYYKENGVVKTNHLIYTEKIWSPLFIGTPYSRMDTVLKIMYKEIEKRPGLTQGFATLKLLPGSTTQAKWEFETFKKRNYTVPDNVILTKQ